MGTTVGTTGVRGRQVRGAWRWILAAALLPAATAARAQAPKAAPNDAPDPADVRTRVSVMKGTRPGAPAIVMLSRPVGPKDWDFFVAAKQSLLVRELVRQALLVAARDELGLQTRDELLDDVPPPPAAVEKMELASNTRRNGGRLVATRLDGGTPRTAVLEEMPEFAEATDYPINLAESVGKMSRKEFVDALKAIGLSGKPNTFRAGAPVPVEVERALQSLDFIDVYGAVRTLHETIRVDGESTERLGALARGYAELALLTCHQWSAAHRAFSARAFLYADRALHRDEKAPLGTWTRAFVSALAGMDMQAYQEIMATAGRVSTAPANAKAAPPWVDVIRHYVKYDVERLRAVKGPYTPLARLLAMQAVEYPHGTRLSIAATRAVLEEVPNCDRAFDALYLSGNISEMHFATDAGQAAFGERLPEKVAGLKGLPKAVASALKVGEEEPELLAALAKAGEADRDGGEPSWGVLARMARDARFVYTLRRLTFMKSWWGVPVDDYWESFEGLVSGHRYRPFLLSIAEPREGEPAFRAFAERLDWSDVEIVQQPMIEKVRDMGLPASEFVWGFASQHGSASTRDLSLDIEAGMGALQQAWLLRAVSPFNPYGPATVAWYDWDSENVRDQLEQWKKEFGEAPVFLKYCSDKLLEAHDPKKDEEAAELLERYIKASPDSFAYTNLAACRWRRGDEEGWKAVLDRYLRETESVGLEHSTVQIQIADWLVGKKRAAEARPYADAAAATWSWSGMDCAARVAEELEDWEGAELWQARKSERYPDSSWDDWYRFCLRSGRGDLGAASELAVEAMDDPNWDVGAPGRRQVNEASAGFFFWSQGKPREALAHFEASNKVKRAEYPALPIALIADEIGDAARRDAMLKEIVENVGEDAYSSSSGALAAVFREALAGGADKAPTTEAWNAAIDTADPQFRPDFAWFISRFMKNRGKADESRRFLDRCSTSRPGFAWVAALAARDLREAEKARPKPR